MIQLTHSATGTWMMILVLAILIEGFVPILAVTVIGRVLDLHLKRPAKTTLAVVVRIAVAALLILSV